jgi:hypothetical protein
MAVSTLEAESAHVTTRHFDPADWLAHFRDVGGWWVVTSGDKVALGWQIAGFRDDQHDRARAMFSAIESETEQRAAIRDHLIAEMGGCDHA